MNQSAIPDFEDINDAPRKKKKSNIVAAIVTGNSEFRALLWNNMRYILLVIAIIFIYINNGYRVDQISKERVQLKERVARLKAESTTMGVELMRISSRNTIKEELRKRNLPLMDASKPPVILRMQDKE